MINADNFDNDYFPEPPTPTNRACPDGGNIILQILQICLRASSKSTRFIYA